MFYRVYEESIVLTPPDLLGRLMRQAAGLSFVAPFGLGARMGGEVIRSRTKITAARHGFWRSKTLGPTTSAVSFTS
jgi:hypothetical protein